MSFKKTSKHYKERVNFNSELGKFSMYESEQNYRDLEVVEV